jgi:hypothetical protein
LWTRLEQAEGEHVARGWFIGGSPLLDEDTPLTAIREDRAKDVTAAVAAFIEGAGGAEAWANCRPGLPKALVFGSHLHGDKRPTASKRIVTQR